MQAAAVCQRLLRLSLHRARNGTVHSVFDHAVNVDFGTDGLIGLLAQEKALTPYAVSARMSDPFTQTGVRAGMAAYLQEGILHIPDARIRLDLSCAVAVDLSIDSIEIRHTDETGEALLLLISEALTAADAEHSLVPFATGATGNMYTKFLAPRLQNLVMSVARGEFDTAEKAAAGCAGCGIGLTPSSDDLLTGYFATLHLLFRAQKLFQEKTHISNMARAAAARTNAVSAAFLLHSGQGLANEAVCDLLRAMYTDHDQTAARNAIRRVLAIGSTSGADMLTGIWFALRYHIGGNIT